MKEKSNRIWTTVLLMVLLGALISSAALIGYREERDRCFQRLNACVDSISQLVAQGMAENQTYLSSVEQLLDERDLTDREGMGRFLSTMGGVGMLTQLELLLPGGQLASGDGTLVTLDDPETFTREAAKGAHICWQPGESEGSILLRQSVPVVRDGETLAVLRGILNLEHIPHMVFAQEYGQEMRLYIFERESGQFLLDTWHDTLTDRASLWDRKSAKGYSVEAFNQDIDQGRTGNTVFCSATTGEEFYASYAPVEVEDWMVMVSVPDRVVFANAQRSLQVLCILLGCGAVMLFVYFFWTLRDIRREKADSLRKLKNIYYILDVEKNLFQAQTDPVYFHRALQKIAEFLGAERAFFWRIDSQEPQQSRRWSDGRQEPLGREDRFQSNFPELLERLREKGVVICLNSAKGAASLAEEGALCRALSAENLMMIPVKRRDGALTGALGVVSREQAWQSPEPLEQVAVSFAMVLEQHETYQRLNRLSCMDTMTGLKNRNGYQEDLLALEEETLDTFACVYVDANGLHELNNRLGHAAGDEMLVQIARALRLSFPGDEVYRIGGDEFVVLCRNRGEQEVLDRALDTQERLRRRDYEVSLGTAWQDRAFHFPQAVKEAEQAMRANKQKFYESARRATSLRLLDEKSAQAFSRQQDMENFLNALAPQFKGVYFVNLRQDSVRKLLIPAYFEAILTEKNGSFSNGLRLYARTMARPEYYNAFMALCDYTALQRRLDRGETLELRYQKNDGSWLMMRVLGISSDEDQGQETLWIFIESPEGAQGG